MNAEQSNALRSFRRVREFLAAHPSADAPPSFTTQVSELDEVMAEVSQEAHEQDSVRRSGKAETQRQRALREQLWTKHILVVARIAREAFKVPGVEEALKLPKKSSDNDRLLAAARGMADAAEKQKVVFAGRGLPDDFAERIRAAASELESALIARVESGRRRVKATARVDAQIKRGSSAVRVLNAILSPKLESDPDLLAAWENAKRLTEPGGGRPAPVPDDVKDIVKVA